MTSGKFLVILPDNSHEYRFRQLFLIDIENNSRTLLTSAEAEVTEIVEWTKEDQVYYISTLPGNPGSRHLFRLQIGDSNIECLTCEQLEMVPSLQKRATCDFVSISMSKEGSYYMMDCKGPDVPYTCLHQSRTNSLLSVWSDNSVLEKKLAKIEMATVQ